MPQVVDDALKYFRAFVAGGGYMRLSALEWSLWHKAKAAAADQPEVIEELDELAGQALELRTPGGMK